MHCRGRMAGALRATASRLEMAAIRARARNRTAAALPRNTDVSSLVLSRLRIALGLLLIVGAVVALVFLRRSPTTQAIGGDSPQVESNHFVGTDQPAVAPPPEEEGKLSELTHPLVAVRELSQVDPGHAVGDAAEPSRVGSASCGADVDCPPDKGCVRQRCVASSCERDGDCSYGQLCRVGNQASARPAVRACAPPGVAKRGETCSDFGVSTASSCGPGLYCLFGSCGPKCDDNPDACGALEGCVHSYRESLAVCLPDCRKSGCANGRLCLPLGELAKCVEPTRDNCLVHGCGPGEMCQVAVQDGQAHFRCRRTCDPLKPFCPEGQLCGGEGGQSSFCYSKCIPNEPTQVCLPNEACLPVDEAGRFFGCR